jgi:glycosyltransferase involved in cell wall biosynthesis
VSEPRQPIRLLWLVESLDSQVLSFAEAIDRKAFDLTVCCLRADGKTGEIVNLGARNARDIGAFRRLLHLLRERQIQLVHSHGVEASVWAGLACRFRKIPFLATLHAAPTAEGMFRPRSIREWLMIEFLRSGQSTIVAASDAVRKGFVSKYRMASNRIEVIHNAVKSVRIERRNPERSIQLKESLGFPPDAVMLTTVAALQAGSGIDMLLRAMATVVRSVPQARLLIVGEGPLKEQWTNLARHLGLADAVRWAGERKDISTILAGSDLFVLPSREDAPPTVLLEAMAAELPVVATNFGGVPEIVDSPAVGSLVKPRDPAALAAEIVGLIGDRQRRAAIAVAGRRRVAETFPMQRWLDRLSTIYREAIGQRTGILRIAVVEFAGRGFLTQYAFQLCRALAAEGADVTLLTDADYEFKGVDHPFRRLSIFDLPDPKGAGAIPRARHTLGYYRQWWKLLNHLQSEKYHVVQLGDLRFPTDLVPLRLVRGRARLLADICHDVPRGSLRAYRRTYGLFNKVFVHHESNAALFKAAFPSHADRVSVIVHGNGELLRELRGPLNTVDRLRKQLGFDGGEAVVLFFGMLAPNAGIDVLIEAFLTVALRDPSARLVISGVALPGFDVEHHVALARGVALGNRVRIVAGHVDARAVAAWMELASVIVFPSRDLDQSATAHLAQTFGVPIVATRVGAMSEVIEDGVTGLLVPPGDPHALGDALSRVLFDPSYAQELGGMARAVADERFHWRGVAREILSAYESVLPRA